MALPPLPENNTARLFIHYQTGGGVTSQEHVMAIRYNAPTVNTFDVMTDLADVLGSGSNEAQLYTGWGVLRAETQQAGSQVRLPATVPGALLAIVGSGGATATPSEQAREVRFIGRGLTTGRRVSLSLYGVVGAAITEADFRFEPTSPGLLYDMLQNIHATGLAGAAYTTIANEPTNWYPYVNWQYNSHWESEQRA